MAPLFIPEPTRQESRRPVEYLPSIMGYRYPVSFMGSLTPMVRNLIIASTALFLLDAFVRGDLAYYLGLVPSLALTGGWIWQFGTYLFIHGSLWHLLFNMLALWMFGSPLESLWGSRRFLRYFLITGIGAGIASAVLAFSSVPIVGSSGAIYGILVAFALAFPDAEILVFFLFPMKAKHYVILFGAIELYFSLQSPGSGIAHLAHLAGMVIGYLLLRPPALPRVTGGSGRRADRQDAGRAASGDQRDVGSVDSGRRPKDAAGRGSQRGRGRSDPGNVRYLELAPPASPDDDFQKKVDAVLDKIRVQGMAALSPEERKILEAASARLKEKPDEP